MSISIRFNPGELWIFRSQRLRFERHLGNDLLYFLDEARLGPFQVEDEMASYAPRALSGRLRRSPSPTAHREAETAKGTQG